MNKRNGTPRKKLALKKAIIRHLNADDLAAVHGGEMRTSTSCECSMPPGCPNTTAAQE